MLTRIASVDIDKVEKVAVLLFHTLTRIASAKLHSRTSGIPSLFTKHSR